MPSINVIRVVLLLLYIILCVEHVYENALVYIGLASSFLSSTYYSSLLYNTMDPACYLDFWECTGGERERGGWGEGGEELVIFLVALSDYIL